MSAVLERRPEQNAVLAVAGTLEVALARDAAEIEQALRLRHRIFVQGRGLPADSDGGIDRDIFDPYCQHLMVRDTQRNQVVGTYRVLMPEQAKLVGCLYTEREFWLNRLNPIRDELVEIGRACVDPDYRSGVAIMLLWSGLGSLLAHCGHGFLIGCASVSTADGGAQAASLYRKLESSHLADETLRVWPRRRLEIETFGMLPAVTTPALMKGYLRAGAKLLGEPHRDDEFVCADFPLLLSLDSLTERYRRRFA